MNLKNFFKNVFLYTPNNNYEFVLPNGSDNKESVTVQNSKPEQEIKEEKIFPSLSVNLEYIKTKYNLMINSDILTREFVLNARGRQYSAFIFYIDGMIDPQALNDFVLEPLMLRNRNNLFDGEQNRVISEAVTNNITVRKVKKFDLADYIQSCLVPQNNIKKSEKFEDIFSNVNSGNCALFIDTLNIAFDIDIKGFKQRSVEKPVNEVIIKGSQEAFVENLRTNTSMLRRLTNNKNLTIENIKIGKITQTNCAVCYIKNIVNTDLIAEVKYRLNNLEIDSLLSAGQLEQLISDSDTLGLPRTLSTERPDNAVKNILEGRVIVIVNGTPYALIIPAILIDFMTSPEDINLKTIFANFLRSLRFLSSIITLLLPGLYVAVTSFHVEILPTELLYSILAARQNVPFPIIVEILLMEFSFEIIREAGLRVPSPIGPTIGIVGALVLGEAAVSAGIVSEILIIIVAITGISSFAIPDFSFGFHLRFFRFIFILLGVIGGFLGIGIGIYIYMSILCNTETFGVPYLIPYSPIMNSKNNSFVLSPVWKREYRATYLASQREKQQEKISMKWKH